MRVVVDANILFAGLLKGQLTRELLLHAPLEMYAPVWLWEETARNLPGLANRSGVPTNVLETLANRLLQRIEPVPEEAMASRAKEALERCKDSGFKDAPYVACCLAVDAVLWSHDQALAREAGVEVVSTTKLLRELG